MNYEIVNLDEKKVLGLKTRTKNDDPNVTRDIGMLWQKFMGEEVYKEVPNITDGKAIALYTNYETDASGKYDVLVGMEVSEVDAIQDKLETGVIEAGKYAKFVVKGDVKTAVIGFWMKLWEMDLDRKYSSDFEEYQNNDMKNAEIHIYISMK